MKSLPVLAAFVLCACTDASPTATAAPEKVEAAPVASGPAWLRLSDLSVHTGTAMGFFVRGESKDGVFTATGDVQGAGTLGTKGQAGYLELTTLQFMRVQESRAPVKPYVEGFMTDAGFIPSSRTVVK